MRMFGSGRRRARGTRSPARENDGRNDERGKQREHFEFYSTTEAAATVRIVLGAGALGSSLRCKRLRDPSSMTVGTDVALLAGGR